MICIMDVQGVIDVFLSIYSDLPVLHCSTTLTVGDRNVEVG